MPRFPDVRRGDAIRASDVSAERRAANELHMATATPPLQQRMGPGGPTLYLPRWEEILCGYADATVAAASTSSGERTAGTGVISVWAKKSNGKWADTGRNEPIVNLFGQSIPSTSWLYVGWLEGEWQSITWDC